ncbi:hypothetical protein DY000_02014467 [Brassica cretica]|uniref:Chlorophyll a-b binding protein, chloroplastic n=1 Tax=Brassica cretica TaxID=69181 RepID=A0ABQ7D2L5_BRACR|nr:hypothetical protein DY000_02014467 [Brassica cretica]
MQTEVLPGLRPSIATGAAQAFGEGGDPGTGPGKLHSREPGILGTGVPSSGDPEAGVLPGSYDPGFHSGRNRTLNPGDDQFPLYQTGVWCYLDRWFFVEEGKLWASDDVLETVEPGALMFPKEELA